jgi:Cdc6-like AAA superfamily ATPase
MVGRTEEFKKVASVVEEAIENKMPAIVPIIAPYGMGKTFTLLQLRQEMKGRFEFFEKTRKVVTAYASATQERFPSKYSSYIYTSCIDDIGESGFAYLRNELSKAGRPPEEALGKLRERDFKAAFIALGEEQSRSTAWGSLQGSPATGRQTAVYLTSYELSAALDMTPSFSCSTNWNKHILKVRFSLEF